MSAIRDLIVDALRQADHVLLGLCLTANLYGLAMIYSATRWKAEYHSMPIKQVIAMCIGIVLYFVVSQFNIQLLVDKAAGWWLDAPSLSCSCALPWGRTSAATEHGSKSPVSPSTSSRRRS